MCFVVMPPFSSETVSLFLLQMNCSRYNKANGSLREKRRVCRNSEMGGWGETMDGFVLRNMTESINALHDNGESLLDGIAKRHFQFTNGDDHYILSFEFYV